MNTPRLRCDVAIVGGGPASLGAATRLRQVGVGHIVVIEREAMVGGIPRHCGHPPFGWQEFHRVLKGPQYATRLQQAAEAVGVDIRTRATAIGIERGPALRVSTPQGLLHIEAKRVLLATGTRETPRSARMVSGTRPMGVLNTGALQSMVYLKSRIPFFRPIIVGTKLVSFSALLTCRQAGIRPVAMVEAGRRPTVWRPATWWPQLQGVRVLMNTELASIQGQDRVSSVMVRSGQGPMESILCDGVVFSGQFVSESALARMGHLDIHPGFGIPVTDQYGRCSDSDFFAAGNMLHPADSSGRCWREGVITAHHIARSLVDDLPTSHGGTMIQSTASVIRYITPQRLILDHRSARNVPVKVRFSDDAEGTLSLWADDDLVWAKPIRARPEKQVILSVPHHVLASQPAIVRLSFETA